VSGELAESAIWRLRRGAELQTVHVVDQSTDLLEARVVQDGDNMRVMPFISQGSATNLEDLLYLRGIDVVVTQADVFEFFRKQRGTPNLEQRVHYIFRFPPSETHVIARKTIRRRLAEHLSNIVRAATAGDAATSWESALPCRRRTETSEYDARVDVY